VRLSLEELLMKTTASVVWAVFLAAGVVADSAAAQQGFFRTTEGTVRILQSSAGGDNVLLIDPATNTVVGEIDDIPVPHGVSYSPDGTYIYVSNEHDATLDVVSRETLKVIKQIPLTNGPNNIAITPDGRKLYVAIARGEGGVDVIDTESLTNVRHIPTAGGVHNVFVSPDGRDLIAGMIGARTLTVIDTSTDQPAWSVPDIGGVRPMEFDVNPDGSTKRIFVELSDLHGFVVVDYETRQVVQKVELPRPPIAETDNDALQTSPSHGLARTPDGRTLWVASKPSNSVFAYSLPDLELVGHVKVGHHPDWFVVTPDSRYLYVSNVGSNAVSVVDRETMSEVTEIPVGQAPKRSHMAVFPN
jgi:YVTN family beta-propeller protein